ncbi:hypothetical protein J3R82DRAFT_2105 [Butyriboletus roseoflavus]|nr:hypothetical protein J3R82DRAFT_2105 [Butyriboletus roseoflavus]
MSASNHIQLYHAALQKFVVDIKAHIRLDVAKERTDFCRESHSFYLTDSHETAKNVMAPEVGGFEGLPTAILTFSLNLEGLKVKTFSKELSGPALDEWREYVKYCREYRKKKDPVPPPHPIVKEGYDVIVGWMSTKRGGHYEPIDSHVWQYAILTERGVSALKFEKVE